MEYKDTIFLPKTSFEMRANLPSKEPKILEEWDKQKIFLKLRKKSEGRDKFILHDGPPYANGHIHMGTALNKILKDVIVRTQQMAGKDSIYVPGWDCHGLPIEWKIEEEYRKKGKNKDDVPVVKFRQECREFAEKWIKIQKKEFRRLGVEGDWANPYLTMSNEAEAQIVRELGKFLIDESLYKGARPVLWSVVEKTALADAEVEYEDHTSNTIYVKFLVTKSNISEIINSNIVIWTTTPWTIPGNRALAYNKDLDYCLIEINENLNSNQIKVGDKLIFAKELLSKVNKEIGISKYNLIKEFKGSALKKSECEHPFKKLGYDFVVKLFHGDFVNLEQGTGVVHIAPAHGDDDYHLGIKNREPRSSFEETIEEDMNMFNKFENTNSVIDDEYFMNYVKESHLGRGLYAQQLKKWFELFDQKHILILTSEELSTDTNKTMNKIFQFLDLPDYEIPDIVKRNTGNYSSMNMDTRKKLTHFYSKYNKDLFKLLSKEFDWNK